MELKYRHKTSAFSVWYQMVAAAWI